MTRIAAILICGSVVAGCMADNYSASGQCVRTGGCASSFSSTGYGPIQAQAAEPDAPSRWQPQR